MQINVGCCPDTLCRSMLDAAFTSTVSLMPRCLLRCNQVVKQMRDGATVACARTLSHHRRTLLIMLMHNMLLGEHYTPENNVLRRGGCHLVTVLWSNHIVLLWEPLCLYLLWYLFVSVSRLGPVTHSRWKLVTWLDNHKFYALVIGWVIILIFGDILHEKRHVYG